jgi:phage shock protein A
MTTQDLQSLKAELNDVEGELHRIAARVERIEQERAAGATGAGSEDELRAALEERKTYEARRAGLRRQITELGHTLEDY